MKYRKFMRIFRIGLQAALVLVLLVSSLAPKLTSAVSQDQQKTFSEGINYFDVCGGSNGGASDSSASGSTTGTPTGGVSFDDSQTDSGNQTTWETDGLGQTHGDGNHLPDTAFQNGGQPLNSDQLHFIALNSGWAKANGIVLGDVAALTYQGKTIYAIYGDVHSDTTSVHAEVSYSAYVALFGSTNSATSSGVHYTLYPGTHTQIGSSFDQAKIDSVGSSVSGAGAPDTSSSNSSDASSCCSSDTATTAGLAPGSGAPGGTTFPNLDPTAMADAINKWVVQRNPNTTFKGLGATIVADGQHSNINPFLLAAIPAKESSMGDPSDFNVSHGNNAYGRTAGPGQPSFQGARSWYKWSSVKASVDYTAPENQGTKVGDMAAYLRNSGFYTAALNSNDLTKLMMTYAPPSENDTVQYVSELKSWISQLVGLAGGQSSGTTTGSTGSGSSSGGSTCCPPQQHYQPL